MELAMNRPHDVAMTGKRFAAVLLSAIVLATSCACGSDHQTATAPHGSTGSSRRFASAAEIASVARMSHCVKKPFIARASSVDCAEGGVYEFPSYWDMQAWLGTLSFGVAGPLIEGPNFEVLCTSKPWCVKVHRLVGGVLHS